MTGYGRGETDHAGTKFIVELNSVNRKQSDVVINLPRDMVELEPRIRQTINENISRGRTSATVSLHSGANGARNLALNTELARSYHEAMRTLQKELNTPGEISITTILQAPGVMRFPEQSLNAEDTWPAVERALRAALADLIKMREREGKHLAKDLIHRLKAIRKRLKEVRALHPEVVKRYRAVLLDRIEKAGLPLPSDDERLLKEITFFADRADVSEELTRLDLLGRFRSAFLQSPPQLFNIRRHDKNVRQRVAKNRIVRIADVRGALCVDVDQNIRSVFQIRQHWFA